MVPDPQPQGEFRAVTAVWLVLKILPCTMLFKLEHMLKDVRLCLEEGQALGVPFPSAAYTREILIAAMGLGHADDDFAAMIEPLQNAGGTEL